jgi:hypothetical protein
MWQLPHGQANVRITRKHLLTLNVFSGIDGSHIGMVFDKGHPILKYNPVHLIKIKVMKMCLKMTSLLLNAFE